MNLTAEEFQELFQKDPFSGTPWPVELRIAERSGPRNRGSRSVVAKRRIFPYETIYESEPLFSMAPTPLGTQAAYLRRMERWQGPWKTEAEGDLLAPLLKKIARDVPHVLEDDEWMGQFALAGDGCEDATDETLSSAQRAMEEIEAPHLTVAAQKFARLFAANSFDTFILLCSEVSGCALYRGATYFNHSCAPNGVHFFCEGQKIRITSKSFIDAGSEITIGYGNVAQTSMLRPRVSFNYALKFDCQCRICREETLDADDDAQAIYRHRARVSDAQELHNLHIEIVLGPMYGDEAVESKAAALARFVASENAVEFLGSLHPDRLVGFAVRVVKISFRAYALHKDLRNVSLVAFKCCEIVMKAAEVERDGEDFRCFQVCKMQMDWLAVIACAAMVEVNWPHASLSVARWVHQHPGANEKTEGFFADLRERYDGIKKTVYRPFFCGSASNGNEHGCRIL